MLNYQRVPMAYCRFRNISRKWSAFTPQSNLISIFAAANVSCWSQQWYLLTVCIQHVFFFSLWSPSGCETRRHGLPAMSLVRLLLLHSERSLIFQCQESCNTCFDPLVHNFVLGGSMDTVWWTFWKPTNGPQYATVYFELLGFDSYRVPNPDSHAHLPKTYA